MTEIIKTKTKGTFKKHNNVYGEYYKPCIDKEGVDDSLTDTFYLADNIPKIPNEQWGRILNLYKKYKSSKSEVAVLFYLDLDRLEYKTYVPEQDVTNGSVTFNPKTDFPMVDIVTGEETSYFTTPNNLSLAGTSHLHPFNLGSFSVIDDTHELGIPGIHILVFYPSNNKQGVTASVVAAKTRFIIEDSNYLIEPLDSKAKNLQPHKKCDSMITRVNALHEFYKGTIDYSKPRYPTNRNYNTYQIPSSKKWQDQVDDLVLNLVGEASAEQIAEYISQEWQVSPLDNFSELYME